MTLARAQALPAPVVAIVVAGCIAHPRIPSTVTADAESDRFDMSSYSCVIPLDWAVLWGRVLPAWIDVLAGKRSPASFANEFAPDGGRYDGDVLVDPDEDYRAPVEYLTLFAGRPLQPPYLRSVLDGAGQCTGFLRSVDSYASPLLEMAIKQTAGVDLAGEDPYAGDVFAKTTYAGGQRPAAGTKNSYRFLEKWFESSWQPTETSRAYERRPIEGAQVLQTLLEALFLYERTLPGVWFPRKSPSWPAFDDLSFAGYLSPDEVRALAHELSNVDAVALSFDELFPLFLDRVARSAQHGFGLLTIHAGL